MVRQSVQMFLPLGVAKLQEIHYPRLAPPDHSAVPRPAVLHTAWSSFTEDGQRMTDIDHVHIIFLYIHFKLLTT